jgi:predicted dienelactone hydrolase
MKVQILGLLLGLAMTDCAVAANAPPFHAGVSHLAVEDVVPFDTLVWYPTEAPEIAWQAGELPVAASRDAPIAAGPRFPVILLSHGSGGSPLGHRDLATRLARDGFIVVAPTQIGDSAGHTEGRDSGRSLLDRPRQAVRALDTALADPRFADHADSARIGMVGFSAGAYTTLVLAGARPDFARATAYCRDHGDDRGSCGNGGGNRVERSAARENELAAWQPSREKRLKAIVLMDPLAMPFDAASLAAVRVTTLLIRPASDDFLKAPANAATVAAGLPQPPQQITVPGSHFVFLDPCPQETAARVPALCQDAPGVDRVAIHRQIEGEISDFLRRSL